MKTRPDNWPALLWAFVQERQSRPFVWGEHDCCLFAADWVRELHGIDLAADVRGGYSSALGAARIVGHGFSLGTFVGDRLAVHGFAKIPVLSASRGDLVAAHVGAYSRLCFGIVVDHRAAFPAPAGLMTISLNQAAHGWKL
jgi:hypothetical protein